MAAQCKICDQDSAFAWRMTTVEKRVDRLQAMLMGTLVSSVSTLVGVIIMLVVK